MYQFNANGLQLDKKNEKTSDVVKDDTKLRRSSSFRKLDKQRDKVSE